MSETKQYRQKREKQAIKIKNSVRRVSGSTDWPGGEGRIGAYRLKT